MIASKIISLMIQSGITCDILLTCICVLQFGFFWAVGVTRFTDNKHNISDIVAGWFLGTCIGLIYGIRAVSIHKYVALDSV